MSFCFHKSKSLSILVRTFLLPGHQDSVLGCSHRILRKLVFIFRSMFSSKVLLVGLIKPGIWNKNLISKIICWLSPTHFFTSSSFSGRLILNPKYASLILLVLRVFAVKMSGETYVRISALLVQLENNGANITLYHVQHGD